MMIMMMMMIMMIMMIMIDLHRPPSGQHAYDRAKYFKPTL